MKKLFIILVIVLNVLSCTFSQKSKDKNKDFSYIIEEALKRKNYVIPDTLFSFFPDKSDMYKYLEIIKIAESAQKTETPFEPQQFNVYRIVEIYLSKNKTSLEQLSSEYRSQSLFSAKSENNDYFILDYGWELSLRYDTLQLKEQYLKLGDNPLVFNFRSTLDNMPFLYDTTTISGLPAGYEILILKSGSNFVLPQDRLYEWSVLPNNLKHGYRSGVAFKESEPYIIYWVMTW